MKKLLSRNALTRVINKQYPYHTKQQTAVVLNKSEVAFQLQRERSTTNKLLILHQFIKILDHQQRDIAKIISIESGRPVYYLRQEINLMKSNLQNIAKKLEKILGKQQIQGYDNAYIKLLPIGTVLHIPYWRYSVFQSFASSISNLLLGNCVLMHTPNILPTSFDKFQKMLDAAGWNNGQYQTLLIHQNELQYIMDHECIAGVNFSGKEEVAKKIAAKAGSKLIKSVIKTQGMGSFVVLEDANVQKTAKLATKNICRFSGQDCYSPKIYLVMDSIYDSFKKSLLENLNEVIFGNPTKHKTSFGPIIINRDTKLLYKQVTKIPKQWKLIFKSQVPKQFFPITVFQVLSDWNEMHHEKFVGPVICLYRITEREEILEIVNKQQNSLFSIVFGQNNETNMVFLDQIQTGNIWFNSLPGYEEEAPTGSIKKFGYGRQSGQQGFKQFANIRLYYQK